MSRVYDRYYTGGLSPFNFYLYVFPQHPCSSVHKCVQNPPPPTLSSCEVFKVKLPANPFYHIGEHCILFLFFYYVLLLFIFVLISNITILFTTTNCRDPQRCGPRKHQKHYNIAQSYFSLWTVVIMPPLLPSFGCDLSITSEFLSFLFYFYFFVLFSYILVYSACGIGFLIESRVYYTPPARHLPPRRYCYFNRSRPKDNIIYRYVSKGYTFVLRGRLV